MVNRFLNHGDEPAETDFIYVMIPAPFEPDEREGRFGQPLDAELRLAGIGFVSGGGQLLDTPDEDGDRAVIFCGIDVDTIDVAAARALLHDHLPDLGCPAGTCIQYGKRQDRFDGRDWTLDEPRDEGE